MSSMSKDEINVGLFDEVSRLQSEIKEWERIVDEQIKHLTRNGKQTIELKTELDLLTDIINNSKHADEIWDEYNKVKETFK